MALYRCEGIILRVQPFAEADRLVTLLCPDLGKVRALARGANKPRSTLAAAVQPFVHAQFVLWRGRALDGITSAAIVAHHGGLTAALDRLAAASYCCDLADAFAVEQQEAQALFAALQRTLTWCATIPPGGQLAVLLRWFELALLRGTGFGPELEQCAACGTALVEPFGATGFSAEAGGCLCPMCAGMEAGAIAFPASALRALRHLGAVGAERLFGVRIGPRTMAAMDLALGRHIGGILQRPLRTRALLDSLAGPDAGQAAQRRPVG